MSRYTTTLVCGLLVLILGVYLAILSDDLVESRRCLDLGKQYFDARQYEQAIKQYRCALSYAQSLIQRGGSGDKSFDDELLYSIFRDMGHAYADGVESSSNINAALQFYNESLRVKFNVDVAHKASTLLFGFGRLDEAGELVKTILHVQPLHVPAMDLLSLFRPSDVNVDSLQKVIQRLLDREKRSDVMMTLGTCHFIYARIYLRSVPEVAVDKAWKHLSLANRYSCAAFKFSSAKQLVHHQRALEFASSLSLETGTTIQRVSSVSKGVGRRKETFLFIVGLPRCGSTLLSAQLERVYGSQTCSLAEQPIIRNALLEATGSLPSTKRSILSLARDVSSDAQKLKVFRKALISHLRACETSSMEPTKRIYVSKALNNFVVLGLIQRALPEQLRVVAMHREPTELCVGMFSTAIQGSEYAYSCSLQGCVQEMHFYYQMLHTWQCSMNVPIHHIHLEELSAFPKRILTRLVDFIGIPAERIRDDGHFKDDNTSAVFCSTASTQQVREPVHTRFIGKYRKLFGDARLQTVGTLLSRVAMWNVTDGCV